jgi:hypothetical protein
MEQYTHGEYTCRDANLKWKQIDFTQAFPQAKLKEDIYL